MALTDRERRVLGENLTAARKKQGWNLTYAAGRAGISISQLSMWENAKREPEIVGLLTLAVAYSCPIDAFLGGVMNAYDAIIEAPLPLDARRHYEAKVDAAMGKLAEVLRQTRSEAETPLVPTTVTEQPETARGKSVAPRARRKRGK
jgi:transcriptional regulator with XRE-family HTH domain